MEVEKTLNLLFVTNYYAVDPEKIRGGIGYRYVGLYNSLMKSLLRQSPKSHIFWHSQKDNIFRVITQEGIVIKNSCLLKSIFNSVKHSLKNKAGLIVIMAYPYVVPKFAKVFEYLLSLLSLKVFSLIFVKTVIDDFDPPVEAANAVNIKAPNVLMTVYSRALELLTLKSSSFVIVLNEFWKKRIGEIYGINPNRFIKIPNGALTKYINYGSGKSKKHQFNILYGGTATKVRGVDTLIKAISELKEDGLDCSLYVGRDFMHLPTWIHVSDYPWPKFVHCVLENADICVVPYPPDKVFFSSIAPVKLFDYMAAGKPVVSTNIEETSKIIREYNCGLIAKDWNEFKFHIKTLYFDRTLAMKLGKNGRIAAERYFNWDVLAETLLKKLSKIS